MSAEILRRAAALMRERAESCVDGWDMEHTPATWHETYHVGVDYDQDAPHIASWHPAVALAVAHWLDEEAADASEPSIYPNADEFILMDSPALAVARAYLGESS